MDHRQDDQLPEKLRDALVRYEIPYEHGRWERFAEKAKRRRRAVVLKWASMAAAAVLLVFLLNPPERMDKGNTWGHGHVAETRNEKKTSVIVESNTRTPSAGDSIANKAPVSASRPLRTGRTSQGTDIQKQAATKASPAGLTASAGLEAPSPPPLYTHKTDQRIPDEKQTAAEVPSGAALAAGPTSSAKLAAPAEQSPMGEKEAHPMAEMQTKSDRKTASTKKTWNFGLEVATAITDKAYLGGGITATYAASPKLSLQGSVGWQHLGMNRQLRQPVLESDYRSLTGTETLVSGIDIPLSVSYHITNGLYAALGVSAYIVLREEKNLIYHERELLSFESTNPVTGEPQIHYQMVEYDARYPSPDRDFLNTPLGFIQFSAGKRLPIGTGLSLTAEPYLKVPIGQANTPMAAPYGGLRLKVSF